MSQIRPECHATNAPAPKGPTAYLIVYHAVKSHSGLFHGKLDGPHGEHCAIGWAFHDQPSLALPTAVIDEVAMVNDSMPTATMKQRRAAVLRWLRWKLADVGMVKAPKGVRPVGTATIPAQETP